MVRGDFDRLGWKHYDIPVSVCAKCNHRIYRDEGFERRPFTDDSGNNDAKYFHKKCPTHIMHTVKWIVEFACDDCGITERRTYDKLPRSDIPA